MKPSIPDTPLVRALRGLSPEDLENELRGAEASVAAANAYLEWVKLGVQIAAAASPPGNGKKASGNGQSEMRPPQIYKKPSLRNAVLMLMHEAGAPRVWLKGQLFDALVDRGWAPDSKTPKSQLATRLSEMVERGEIRRLRVGQYELVRPN